LELKVSQPSGVSVQGQDVAVDVTPRTVNPAITTGNGQDLYHGEDIVIGLELRGSDGQALQNVGFKVLLNRPCPTQLAY